MILIINAGGAEHDAGAWIEAAFARTSTKRYRKVMFATWDRRELWVEFDPEPLWGFEDHSERIKSKPMLG